MWVKQEACLGCEALSLLTYAVQCLTTPQYMLGRRHCAQPVGHAGLVPCLACRMLGRMQRLHRCLPMPHRRIARDTIPPSTDLTPVTQTPLFPALPQDFLDDWSDAGLPAASCSLTPTSSLAASASLASSLALSPAASLSSQLQAASLGRAGSAPLRAASQPATPSASGEQLPAVRAAPAAPAEAPPPPRRRRLFVRHPCRRQQPPQLLPQPGQRQHCRQRQ